MTERLQSSIEHLKLTAQRFAMNPEVRGLEPELLARALRFALNVLVDTQVNYLDGGAELRESAAAHRTLRDIAEIYEAHAARLALG